MWVMGGPVRGRRVYGKWFGLAPDDLYQQRELAVTTDFREPIAEVLRLHLGLSEMAIEKIFPQLPNGSGNASTLVRL